MKKQIWFRPDQLELVVACLEYTKSQLNCGTVLSEAHKMAGRYTFARIDEILAMLTKEEQPK